MIALFGGDGSIGSRYKCILTSLNIPFEVIEVNSGLPNFTYISQAIIATPTETHCKVIKSIPEHIPILCEKPLSKVVAEIPDRDLCFVVNNYQYALRVKGLMPPYSIWYNYFKTGTDGLYWDCCQLIYLDEDARLDVTSPRWNLTVNREWIKYRDIEESYVRMISDFASEKYYKMWGMDVAREMTRKVILRERHADHYRNTG